MAIRAQMGMVMNLDKCIGCHTCSVTCKNVWTNREGTEYVWFNNVETKPGRGYPRDWEDQEQWQGGWKLDRKGKLKLKGGGRVKKALNIFHNPDLPTIDDYYEPWTYDYDHLISAPSSGQQPVAQPQSKLTGEALSLQWGPNWDDDLAGSEQNAANDPNRRGELEERVRLEFEQSFMMYLPRICEHCINPSCVASCPSGAMYKREEDGIVLVDQEACRGWRYCVSGCPYKKTYFNWDTGKAEKCTFCYPRIEAGMPTVCAETCVGRLRHIGIVLYDSDRVEAAASVADERDLLGAQLDLFCDPGDPEVRRRAEADGIPHDWIEAARRSPVYDLAVRWQVALPLHPEYRTLPMVWYVPPLSPVLSLVEDGVDPAVEPGDVFGTIDELRIPVEYLASMLSAGDPEPVRLALRRLAAMRAYKRTESVDGDADSALAEAVGIDPADMELMFKQVAIGDYDDRYVIPKAHPEAGDVDPHELQGSCGLEWVDRELGPGAPEEAAHFDLRDQITRVKGGER